MYVNRHRQAWPSFELGLFIDSAVVASPTLKYGSRSSSRISNDHGRFSGQRYISISFCPEFITYDVDTVAVSGRKTRPGLIKYDAGS